MAKKLVDWAQTLVSFSSTTRQAAAGVSGKSATVHSAQPFVAGTPVATEFVQVLPPSTDTPTATVWVVRPPPAIQTKGTVPLDTLPASANEAACNQGSEGATLAAHVPPCLPTFTRPPLGIGSLVQAVEAGLPASSKGEETVSDVRWPLGSRRPSVSLVLRW